jgi:hypothetical protein
MVGRPLLKKRKKSLLKLFSVVVHNTREKNSLVYFLLFFINVSVFPFVDLSQFLHYPYLSRQTKIDGIIQNEDEENPSISQPCLDNGEC